MSIRAARSGAAGDVCRVSVAVLTRVPGPHLGLGAPVRAEAAAVCAGLAIWGCALDA